MNVSYVALRRPSPPRQRGFRIWLKRRVTRLFHRVTGRVSRAFIRCCSRLRRIFLKVGPGSGYVRVKEENRARRAPKGHLTVYVGGAAEAKRVVVPVVYINHPLFKRLLEEAQEKHGFDHPGGITIPCPVSEFETVKSRIVAGRARNGPLPWLGSSHC
uniref:Uncharacterized protein n=1 Tax=Chenopodium quinoa TaxID=63459 RepID=A0A803LI79_CHEQI